MVPPQNFVRISSHVLSNPADKTNRQTHKLASFFGGNIN